MLRDTLHWMKGIFSNIVISTVVVALVIATLIAVGAAAAQTNVTGETGTSTTSTGSKTDSSTAVATDPNIMGQNDPGCVEYAELVSAKDLPDGGKIYTYSLDGSLIPEPVPPPGWNPLTASDDELKQYGPLFQRPSEPAKLQDWSAKMSRLSFTGKPSQMCKTNHRSGLTHIENYSFPWAGGMTVNGTTNWNTFYWATGKWYQTAFQQACINYYPYDTYYTSYSTWAGLGGWNNNNGQQRLIQTGTDAAKDWFEGIYPWWEMLNSTHSNPEVAFSGNVINPGDDVQADVYYDTANNVIYMAVKDWTTGGWWGVGPISNYANDSAYDYWDGSTADFVTENTYGGLAPGGWYELRKPYLGNTYYYYATANGQPIANFWSWQLNEKNWPYTGDVMQTSTFDGIHAWYDNWVSCW